MQRRIVIAPDGFKGSLTAAQAAAAMADGARRALPDAIVTCIPLADGGEGTLDALLSGGGQRLAARVTGPLGDPLSATYGLLPDDRTAILEMSAASGFELLHPSRRDPLRTTTFGTGELILAAAQRIQGAQDPRIIIGAGGSATVDAGCGALQALGVRFLDRHAVEIADPLTGGALERVHRIDASPLAVELARIRISVACDVDNPLCGPAGAARVFAPQKGADAAAVALLERNLEHIAGIFARDLGVRVADMPRAGAAGGLPAGLHAALGAELLGGAELILRTLKFDQQITGADLLITGEGRLDATTLHGKVVLRVADAARHAGVPVVAVAGTLDPGAEPLHALLNGIYPLADDDDSLRAALARPVERLAEVTERAVRDWSATSPA